MNIGYFKRFQNILKSIEKKWASSLTISHPPLLPGRDTEVQYTDAQTCSPLTSGNMCTHTLISTHNVFREGIYVLTMSIALLLPVETFRFCLSSIANQIRVV